MKNKIGLIFLAVLVTAALASCKKNEDDTTKPSIYGLSIDNHPSYVGLGETVNFDLNLDNIYTSDNKDPGTLGIFWQVNTEKRDTTTRDALKINPTYSYTFTELGSYTIAAYLFTLNDSYYVASEKTTVQAIDPETALSYPKDMSMHTEILDGESYYVVNIGNLKWLAENLHVKSSGRNYQDCPVMATVFGKYYTWEEAQLACPDGWRLPTAQEFDNCLGTESGALMADATFLEKKMWTYWPQVVISNDKHFNALPVGYTDLAAVQGTTGLNEYAIWWTSDDEDGYGIYRYIYCEEPKVKAGRGSISSLALSVRCVKDI